VYITFIPVDDLNIIRVTILVQIEVVHLRVLRVEQSLEFFRRRRFLEKLKCAFQAKIVAWNF